MQRSKSKNIFNLLRRFWGHINAKRKRQLYLLLALMVVASATEAVSIGLTIPFLGILANPDVVYDNQVLGFIFQKKILSHQELLWFFTIAFAFFAIFSGVTRLLLVWSTSHLSFAAGADISLEMYRRVLSMPYISHVSQNSSDVINGITNKANSAILNIIIPFLIVISSFCLLAAILITLLFIAPYASLLSIVGFGLIYMLIGSVSKNRLLMNGKNIAIESTRVIKYLQEGLGGIRDILIDGTQAKFIDEYSKADSKLRHSQGDNYFLSQSPRFIMESLGMVFIAIIAYLMSIRMNGMGAAVPILGALALGAQRSLPLLQRIYVGWSSLHGNLASLQDIIDLLELTPDKVNIRNDIAPINFKRSIHLSGISFSYADKPSAVIDDISIEISKGCRVGIVGSTGCGKTTLLDILMGLLEPSSGGILVDGVKVDRDNVRAWQKRIAHVPQRIFLADASIAENIAFGVSRNSIDYDRVIMAAKRAQLFELINGWPDKFETNVGERGARLSGGQMQRIGIARAFYKNADVIIFDEATSALDAETENYVMQAIENLGDDLTIIIIAHRLTTLMGCSKVVKLENGRIIKEGSYVEVIGGALSA